MNAEVTIREDSPIAHALSPATVVEQVKLIQHIMKDVMRKDEHYGAIPGVRVKEGEKPKMVLLKAGAEKLCFTFQLVPSFTINRTDHANGHREYEIICRLTTRSGVLVAEGMGTCSTLEPKYRYRSAGRKCPTCGAESIIKGREEYGGGWLCFAKKGGCGAKFQAGDKSIEGQEAGKVENPDPAEQYNTVLKMGKKRAHVDATITACAASDIFTQDIEELPEYETPAPSQNQEQRNKAAASPDPADVPHHDLDAKAKAKSMWEELRAMDKDGQKAAAAIKHKHGTDYAAMIPELESQLLKADERRSEAARDAEPVVITE